VTVLALLSSSCGSEADEEPAPAFGGILEPDVSVPATPEVAGVDTSAGDGTAVVSWVTDSDGGSPICIAEVEVVGADGDDPTQAHSGACVVGAITAGDNYSCAAGAGGVKCWGGGSFGRLGTGNTSDVGDEPDEMGVALNAVDLGVDRDGNPFEATEVAAGRNHSCAVGAAGGVKCWGQGGLGRLGNGNGDTSDVGDESDEMGVALDVVDLGVDRDGNPFKARSVTAGDHHSCAMDAAGDVKCWGVGSYGQLGNGDKLSVGSKPGEMGVALDAVDLGVDGDGNAFEATEVAAGRFHSCAMGAAGGVKCWGRGSAGQLGTGNTSDNVGDKPDEMGVALNVVDLGVDHNGNPFKARLIAAGDNHSCAVGAAGGVKCWGQGSSGQLGNGDNSPVGDKPDEMGVALDVVDLGVNRDGNPFEATEVAAGSNHSCAVGDAGGVKCWGAGSSGQLGNGDNSAVGDKPDEMGVALDVVDLGVNRDGNPFKARSVTAGDNHSCAMDAAGDVKCWGAGSAGQLGTGNTSAVGDEPDEMGVALDVVDLGVVEMGIDGSVQVAGLTPGEYTVRVRVANAAGFSDWSEPYEFSTLPEPPGAPTNLEASPAVGGVALSWTAPEDAEVTDYRVEYRQDGDDTWVVVDDGFSSATSAFVELDPGGWLFRVSATVLDEEIVEVVDLADSYGEPATVGPVGPVTVPDTPTVTEVDTAAGDGTAVVSWATGDDGGSPICTAEVEVATADGQEVSADSWPCDVDDSVVGLFGSVQVAGLTPGEYTVRVRVANAAGFSDWSEPYEFSTLPEPPGAPTNLEASPAVGGVALSWTAPEDAEVTDYRVEYRQDGDDTWVVVDDGFSSATSAFVELDPGGWLFRVSATVLDEEIVEVVDLADSYGEPATVGPVGPVTVPDTPTVTEVDTAAGDGTAVVSWATGDDGGSPICTAEVEVATADGQEVSADSWPCDVDDSVVGLFGSVQVAGLTPGEYTVRVRVANAAGFSDWSEPFVVDVPPEVPGRVEGLAAVPLGRGILVTWSSPVDDGGSTVTGYRVVADCCDSPLEKFVGPDTALEAVFDDLVPGATYEVTVVAVNDVGPGEESKVQVSTYALPGAPTDLVAAPGDSRVVLSWVASAALGDVGTVGYAVQYRSEGCIDGEACWETLQDATGGSTATATGLVNGTAYTFRVRAQGSVAPSGSLVSGELLSSEWVSSGWVTPYTTPDAPTDVSGVAGAGEVAVSWTAPGVDGGNAITGYTVEYSADAGGSWSTFASGVAAQSVTVTGLVNGSGYVFRVSATNEAGTGPWSEVSASVTPYTVPDAPTDVSGVAGAGEVAVSWTAPGVDGGSAITGYKVEYSSDDGKSWTTAVADTASADVAHTVTGLTNGTGYVFRVSATNAAGTGAASAVSTSVTPYTVPDAPVSVVGSAGDSQAAVSWTAGGDGGSAITGYKVEYSSDDGDSWATAVADTASADVAYTVTGLTNGTGYVFRVSATNAAGTGAATTSASATVSPRTTPGAPTAVAGTPGDSLVALSWTAPGVDGGSAITGYTVRYSSDDGGSWTTAATGVVETTLDVTGLTNGTGYVFEVRATNAAGDGDWSARTAAITPYTLPGAPTAVAGVGGDTLATVSWAAPSVDGGNAVTGYTVEYSSDTGGSWTTAATGVTAITLDVTGLTNGTGYVFRVSATNAAGAGPWSEASAPVTPYSVPDALIGVTGEPGDSQVAVSWLASVDDGGSAVTDYTVEYSSDAGVSWSTFTDGTSTDTSATVTGLFNGTAYVFRVSATNPAGAGPWSEASTPVTPHTTPDAPTGLVGLVGDGEVLLGWTAPADDGGNAVVDYVVEYSTGDGTGWVTIVDGASAATTLAWAGVSNGVDYAFRVSAANAAGTGPWSEASVTLTPFGVPAAPSSVVASGGDASAVLGWSAPAFDGGSPVTGYRVEYSTDAGANWTVVIDDTASVDTSLVVDGLTNGVGYLFRVAAINAAGVGDTAIASAQVNPRTTASAPVSTAAVAGNGTVALSWLPPLIDGGSAVTGYVVAYRPETSGEWTVAGAAIDTTTTVIDGLVNGEGYVFRVRAVTSVGDGDWSATVSATPVTVPSPPPGVAVAASDAAVTVSWSTPASDGGSPIIDYVVEASVDAGATWVAVTDGASTANSTVAADLANGTAHVFRVRAVNEVGASGWSPTSSAATPAAAAPAPVAVTVGYPDDVWAGILRSLADGETPEAFQTRAIIVAAGLTGRARDADTLPLPPPAPFTADEHVVTTVYAGGTDADILTAFAGSVGYPITETQYAATYLLVFITDLTAWSDSQLVNWLDYLTTS
jgi:titin